MLLWVVLPPTSRTLDGLSSAALIRFQCQSTTKRLPRRTDVPYLLQRLRICLAKAHVASR